MRDYADEKKVVYWCMKEIVGERLRGKKKDRVLLAEIRERSGLNAEQCSTALKWLKKRGLLRNVEGKCGWFLTEIRIRNAEALCWKHGTVNLTRGRKKERFCLSCEARIKQKTKKEE